jgi:hypothetical protein
MLRCLQVSPSDTYIHTILKGDGALTGVKFNMSPLANVESKAVAPGACYDHRCQNHHLLAQRCDYSVAMCLLTIRDVIPFSVVDIINSWVLPFGCRACHLGLNASHFNPTPWVRASPIVFLNSLLKLLPRESLKKHCLYLSIIQHFSISYVHSREPRAPLPPSLASEKSDI